MEGSQLGLDRIGLERAVMGAGVGRIRNDDEDLRRSGEQSFDIRYCFFCTFDLSLVSIDKRNIGAPFCQNENSNVHLC